MYIKSEGAGGKYEAPSTKFDMALRERDGKAEKVEKTSPLPSMKHEKTDENKETTSTYSRPPLARPETNRALEGYVGFANLPNQVYRKAVKRGFEFTLMLVGKLAISFSSNPLSVTY